MTSQQDDLIGKMFSHSVSKQVSSCCRVKLVTHHGEEGTNYYTCDRCGNPCDIWTPDETPKDKEVDTNPPTKQSGETQQDVTNSGEWRERFREKFTKEMTIEYGIGKTKPIRLLICNVNETGEAIESFIQQTIDEEVKKEREKTLGAVRDLMNRTFITTDVYIMKKVMKVIDTIKGLNL